MTVTCHFDERNRLVRISADSGMSIDEWFEAVGRALDDPRFGPGYGLVYDRTAVAEVPSAATVRGWVQRTGPLMREHGNPRLAFVVSEPVAFGMVRMAASYAETEGVALGVFWTESEALEWIGRSPSRRGSSASEERP